jgi:hypothetical protein
MSRAQSASSKQQVWQVVTSRTRNFPSAADILPENRWSTLRNDGKNQSGVAARRDPDFMIIARTDARAVEDFDRTVDRAQRYMEAGADAIFPKHCKAPRSFAILPVRSICRCWQHDGVWEKPAAFV